MNMAKHGKKLTKIACAEDRQTKLDIPEAT